jgi:L-ascorbate metabolism protein UlaG (beta-lactamase superfamily)
MRLTLLRDATLVIEHGTHRLLVDPMLGRAGSLVPFAWVRHRARRNPLVPLPDNAVHHLQSLTGAVITHFVGVTKITSIARASTC